MLGIKIDAEIEVGVEVEDSGYDVPVLCAYNQFDYDIHSLSAHSPDAVTDCFILTQVLAFGGLNEDGNTWNKFSIVEFMTKFHFSHSTVANSIARLVGCGILQMRDRPSKNSPTYLRYPWRGENFELPIFEKLDSPFSRSK